MVLWVGGGGGGGHLGAHFTASITQRSLQITRCRQFSLMMTAFNKPYDTIRPQDNQAIP